jgi:hypothetical protein
LKASLEEAVIRHQRSPWERVFENLSAYDCASKSHQRDYANKGAAAHGRDKQQNYCHEQ